MEPTTYNLLEAMVRAVSTLARDANCDEALKQDLTGKLTSVKVMMQRQSDEDVVQAMAETVIALTKFVMGQKPAVEGRIERKHVQSALAGLQKHHESRERTREAVLHPSGACTCSGDGLCEWCLTHCVHCGAEAEQHGPGSTHYFEPHGPAHEPDPQVADEKVEHELQHGGELREKEPPFEIDYEEAGLDPKKWNPITDGDVIIAALPEDTPEEMKDEMVLKILAVWNEWQYDKRPEG